MSQGTQANHENSDRVGISKYSNMIHISDFITCFEPLVDILQETRLFIEVYHFEFT